MDGRLKLPGQTEFLVQIEIPVRENRFPADLRDKVDMADYFVRHTQEDTKDIASYQALAESGSRQAVQQRKLRKMLRLRLSLSQLKGPFVSFHHSTSCIQMRAQVVRLKGPKIFRNVSGIKSHLDEY
jgi:hypothetical protein